MRYQLMITPLTLFFAFLGLAAANGTISGTVHAPAGRMVAGTIVYACLPSSSGCDENASRVIEIQDAAPSAPFTFGSLSSGSFIVLAWQDLNGNGEMEEDELAIYSQTGSEPALVTPPTQGITLHLPGGQAQTQQGNSSVTLPAALHGSWRQGSASSVHYYNPSNGTWAPPSGSGFRYTFSPDGRYTYSGLMQTSVYSCTTTLFSYKEGTVAIEGQVMMLTPSTNRFRSQDTCNASWNYEKDVPLEPSYYLWRTAPDPYGGNDQVLELTSLVLQQDGTLDLDPESPDPSMFFED